MVQMSSLSALSPEAKFALLFRLRQTIVHAIFGRAAYVRVNVAHDRWPADDVFAKLTASVKWSGLDKKLEDVADVRWRKNEADAAMECTFTLHTGTPLPRITLLEVRHNNHHIHGSPMRLFPESGKSISAMFVGSQSWTDEEFGASLAGIGYRLRRDIGELGQGAFGSVFAAEDIKTKRLVAIKERLVPSSDGEALVLLSRALRARNCRAHRALSIRQA